MTNFGGLGRSLADLVTADIAVEADLTLRLDGSTARLTGSGQRLSLHVDSPAALLSPVPGRSPLRAALAVADILRNAGMRVDITTDRGRLFSVGAGVRGPGSWLRALPPVAAGSPVALAAVGWPVLGGVLRERRRPLLLAAGAVVLVIGRGWVTSGSRRRR